MDAVRDGALRDRPVTVLGFARSGIALARFLADAGARVTIYDGRPAASSPTRSPGSRAGRCTLALGPDVDPATAWADAALVTTSPSINPDYPTTEPRLRAALQAMVAARAEAIRRLRRSSPSRTCSCGCAWRRRSVSPARRARRRRPR